jgi:hypothetical protein
MGVVDFTKIDNLLDAIDNLDEGKIWEFSIDKEVQDEIIRMNTQDQLFEQGIDSLGRSLGDYSPFTVQIKKSKRQRVDHITLYDEGDFYNSFTVRVNKQYFEIDADDSSKYDVPLFQVYGVDVLGLTEESMTYLKKMIIENYIKYLVNELL